MQRRHFLSTLLAAPIFAARPALAALPVVTVYRSPT